MKNLSSMQSIKSMQSVAVSNAVNTNLNFAKKSTLSIEDNAIVFPDIKINNFDEGIDIFTPIFNNGWNKAIEDIKFIIRRPFNINIIPIHISNITKYDAKCELFGKPKAGISINCLDKYFSYLDFVTSIRGGLYSIKDILFECNNINQFNNLFYICRVDVRGNILSHPIDVSKSYTPYQYNSSMVNVNFNMVIDAFTTIIFTILANTYITLYFRLNTPITNKKPFSSNISSITNNSIEDSKITIASIELKTTENNLDIFEPYFNDGYNSAIQEIKSLNDIK